jgi:hydroxymethylpyrimidine/phosphomethylpyrimidine kinase
MKQALTIAGSDSGGGAGIQADIKTMHAHGVFAASVVTAVTAQNTREVRDAVELPVELVRSQLEAVFDDLDILAVKTGMLFSRAIIETVASALAARGHVQLVVDPVMISKSGYKLLKDDAIQSLTEVLLPLALVATPNLHEASLLTGEPITSIDGMRLAARRIHRMGPRAVVVKGGHAGFCRGTDVLFDGDQSYEFAAQTVFEKSVHGTGCTFSAAITARLALGETLVEAVRRAKTYTSRVIENAPEIGGGNNPGTHFYFIEPRDVPGI